MYRIVNLFTLIILGWMAGAPGCVIGQTPNVRAWGYNYVGQLGNGVDAQTASRNMPGQVSGLTGVVAIAGGYSHSLVLKNDGSVWAWGGNEAGALGNGDNADSNLPVQVDGITGVTVIAAGVGFSLASKSDGTVWAWGYNGGGQLGNGTNTNSSVPLLVSGLTGVLAITAGAGFSLALKRDGTVWAWGENSFGELGTGNSTFSSVPVQVSGMTGVVAIAAGVYHSLALKSDGTVWAWGFNIDGELGNGSVANADMPVQVSGLTGAEAIAAGGFHSLALRSDGSVWVWGDNGDGELGNGSGASYSDVPVKVGSLGGVVAIATGGHQCLALKGDHTVWAWGDNTYGELGNGNDANSNVPVRVSGLIGVPATAVGANQAPIAGGDYHSLALMSDGRVWAWGDNTYGELGDGSSADSNLPVQVSGLTGVVAIAGGGSYSLALKSDNTVWAWGENDAGELGNGTIANTNVPVQVTGLTGVVSIAGGLASLALKGDGTVWAWGNNSDVPVKVSGLTEVVAIAGGAASMALKGDGTVWAWGDNQNGELGNGTNINSNEPVQVSGLTGVVAIATGITHGLALRSDGTVWAWGEDTFGELGNGTNANNGYLPTQVSGLTSVVAIAGSLNHSLALKADGTVWAWGDNSVGELGNGSDASYSNVPVQVSSLTGAVAIASGQGQNVALTNDGTVWAWGLGFYGELGNGSNANSSVPVQVSALTNVVAIAGGDFHSLVALAENIPELTVTPASLTFASSGIQTVTLTNTGAAPMAIGNVILTGINLDDFSTSGTCSGASLSPTQSCTLSVTFTPAAAGPRTAGLLLIANAPGSPRLVLMSGTSGPVPSITTGGVVNAANYTGPVAPGSIASVFGNFLMSSPTGLSLQIGATPAPVFFASLGQVNAQIPWELTGHSQATITATLNGETSAAQTVSLAAYAPGIFTKNSEGTGQGAILDTSYQLVDSINPATAGSSVVQIYCTGLGPVTNQPGTGAAAASSPLSQTMTLPTVMIGGAPATVLFSGLAPGFVGEYQVNAMVPAGSAKGSAVQVVISIGGAQSNVVTIAVH